MRARSLRAQGRALSEPPEPLAKFAGQGCPANRGREGALSLGYFSLGKQREVTRPPGRRTKQHKDVSRFSRKPQRRKTKALSRLPLRPHIQNQTMILDRIAMLLRDLALQPLDLLA